MTAAIYTRQSLDKTGEAAGVTRQLEECRALAERKGLLVVAELSDNDTSATTGVRRPGFERLLELVDLGVDTVLVWHPDRLYRKLTDLVKITELAQRSGLTIVSVQSGDLDLNTPSGRLVASLVGAVSTHEGEHRTARQKASYRARAEQGEWHFSHRPFGYRRDGRDVVQVPEEAEVLREVFERYYDEGESRYSLMHLLNARGILTPTGKPWGIIQLRDLLGNSRYAGISTYNGQEVGRGSWEPIVDEATWRRWQTAAAKRKRKSTFTTAKHLMSGIARCGVCGAPCYAKTQDGRIAYSCRDGRCVQRSATRVDSLIEAVVLARLQQPDALEALRPKAAPIEHLFTERETIAGRLESLADLVADGTLGAQAARDAAKPLRLRLTTLDTKIAAQAGSSDIPLDLVAETIVERWRTELGLPAKRAIIRTLMEVRIDRQDNPLVFDPERIAVQWVA